VGVRVASTAYRPVGFGSHHWKIIDAGGRRWFVTVDDLENKRHSRREPLDTAFDRLRASLAAATALRAQGYSFAVAPIPTLGGEPLTRGATGSASRCTRSWTDGASRGGNSSRRRTGTPCSIS
jgi:spectinomycin phosphotransferase/16S rRNA (guanine(1405)-N(7))-methyltransferase